jgi:hypothetical protein
MRVLLRLVKWIFLWFFLAFLSLLFGMDLGSYPCLNFGAVTLALRICFQNSIQWQ